jgi:hypothetical protein
MPVMPRITRPPPAPSNLYQFRWRWWYTAISDWMIRNPGRPQTECAAALGKHSNTICMIVGTDMFRAYHDQRLAEFREMHDFAVSTKLSEVTELALDVTKEVLIKKRDAVPLKFLSEVLSGGLEALGYGPKPQGPSVSLTQTNVTASITVSELEEARNALRTAEQRRALSASRPQLIDQAPQVSDSEETAAVGGGAYTDESRAEGAGDTDPDGDDENVTLARNL